MLEGLLVPAEADVRLGEEFVNKAVGINDDIEMDSKTRERRLISLFKKYRIKLSFK